MSQNQKIKAALLRGEKITALSAFRKWGVLRLGGRIFEIRRELTVLSRLIRVGRKWVSLYYVA